MINSVDRYAAPKLMVYGSMVTLTASGTLGSCEDGGPKNGGGNCGGGAAPVNPAKKG